MADDNWLSSVATEERILSTKIEIPPNGADHLSRPRLVDRLDSVDSLALICAPAGFGKSVMLADWASAEKRPVAWVSLDALDDDSRRFWRYVILALDRALPGTAERVPGLSKSDRDGQEVSIAAICRAVDRSPRGVTLILDDYHRINSETIHKGASTLIERRPPGLRLLIGCRVDPPLSLARQRATGRLVELREDKLRFTEEECAALLRERWRLDLSAESIASLTGHTEGWAVGLRLAAVALRESSDPDAAALSFGGGHRYVSDYFRDEVLADMPDSIAEFLLRCSTLRRLSGPLCDAVTGRAGGQRTLEACERAGLFVIPLDAERRWFRLQRLFGEFLRHRLETSSRSASAELHQRAGRWFEENGLPDDAVHHAIKAGRPHWAARLMELHLDQMALCSEGTALDDRLSALPREIVSSRPGLLLSEARFALHRCRLSEIETRLDAAAGSLAGDPAHDAMHTMMRGVVAHLRGDAEASRTHVEKALARVREPDPTLSGFAEANLATAAWLGGDLEEAERRMAAALAARPAGSQAAISWGYHYLGSIQRERGKLGAAAETYRRALDAAGGGASLPAVAGVANVGMAALAYERNDLDAAAALAELGVELCRKHVQALPLSSGLITLAKVRHASGNAAGALKALDEAAASMDPGVADRFNPVPSARARILLATGSPVDLEAWAAERSLDLEGPVDYAKEPALVTAVLILLARGDVDQALTLTGRLRREAVRQGRIGGLIEIGAVHALAQRAAGDEAAALDSLVEALTAAEPEDHLRTFLDLGERMSTLMGRLIHRRGARSRSGAVHSFANRVLRAFSTGRSSGSLTSREVEVLRLVAAGHQNLQIARELFVALDTVKKHLTNVYTKLGASGRTDAVAKARGLGLLP